LWEVFVWGVVLVVCVSVSVSGVLFSVGVSVCDLLIFSQIMTDFDRAAPKGTGDVKAGGNYAADLLPLKMAKADGFGTTLYLDCKEHK